MKTNPEALKKLYEALGGASADVENLSLTPDLIEAIAEVAPTGGGGGIETITLSTEEQEALNNTLNGVATSAAAEQGVNYVGRSAGGLSETTFRNILDLYASGKNVNLQILFLGFPLVLTPTAHIAIGSGTDSMLMMSFAVMVEGNSIVQAEFTLVGLYDVDTEDPSGFDYTSSVLVSVCVPKGVE